MFLTHFCLLTCVCGLIQIEELEDELLDDMDMQ